MIQLHFGASDRLLYGVYHPASSPRIRRGAVLLNPYGWEALRAHRTLRTLALRLAGAGIDVLRFDYSCTGDSPGATDAAEWDHWIEDADYALDELQAVAGLDRVSLVGLRMGALVATELTVRRPEAVERQVLWEPPADGHEALAWARSGPPAEAAAFPAGRSLAAGMESAGPTVPGRGPRARLVLTSGAQWASDPDTEVVRLPPERPRCWVEDRDLGAGAVPATLLDRITEWLAT